MSSWVNRASPSWKYLWRDGASLSRPSLPEDGATGLAVAGMVVWGIGRPSGPWSSTKWLLLVSMYSPLKWHPKVASMKMRHFRRWHIPVSLLVLIRNTVTATWLSHLQSTRQPYHCEPQASQDRTIGIISFAAIDNPVPGDLKPAPTKPCTTAPWSRCINRKFHHWQDLSWM